MPSQKNIEIIHYHEETKHHFDRYAKSPGYMDWENQPDPFRSYENTTVFPLPLLKEDPSVGYQNLYRRSGKSSQPFTIKNIAGFLELSLGLSSWKAAGTSRWSLRMNPSSGNLHPSEGYLIISQTESIAGGVYHYNAMMHSLELRAGVSSALWHHITSHFETEGFLIGLSSIFWRESWKYGERAFRYCNHDAGHALAALSIAANLFGWKVTYLNGLSDEAIESVLGLNQEGYHPLEKEHPDLLCLVYPHQEKTISRSLPNEIISALIDLPFSGNPNQLSPQKIDWEIIYKTADLTRKPMTAEHIFNYGNRSWFTKSTSQFSAPEIIRKRRSATSFDSNGSVTRAQFLSMLDKTIPRNTCCPFDAGLMHPSTHLILFVHNVEDISPGLYFFFRNDNDINAIKQISKPDFMWEQVEENFPLFFLKAGNFRQDAMMVSCHQEIAGFSAFSLGMISKFRDVVKKEPFRYRHLFWETGMIGQVLYLEAEAHCVRGTGIGCFFDDGVHDIMGFKDNQYQSLYHFTIGVPVEDPRLTTYPPYFHLEGR
jgi:SagB-type dehydrogenase family enzyme